MGMTGRAMGPGHTFVDDPVALARATMAPLAPTLADPYATIVAFLATHPEHAAALRGRAAPPVGSTDYVVRQAQNFLDARAPRAPRAPTTVPDPLVSLIVVTYFGIDERDAERVKHEHLLSMGAEGLVGDLLERYLASELEPRGWVWCAGSIVRAVDFIRPPDTREAGWRLLQVKNRDNSENSSSSAIRAGTSIEKWFRTFSRRPGSNWDNFPDASVRGVLSEERFFAFVTDYLTSLETPAN